MRFLLGGTFIVLGVFKIVDLQQTNPTAGWTLTVLLGAMWMVEMVKEIRK